MKKQAYEQRRRELEQITAIPDEKIDTSDIPELTEEQLRRGVRGRMYRPMKQPVTMRLDADIIGWLKEQGPGYQTKANRILRDEMLRKLAVSPKRKTLVNPSRQSEPAADALPNVKVWTTPTGYQQRDARARIWSEDMRYGSQTPGSNTPSRHNTNVA